MKTFINAILLSAVASWDVDLSVTVTSSIFLHQTIWCLSVKSDAGGYAQLPCTSHGLDMTCTADDPAESSQGGFFAHGFNCVDKCCDFTITTKEPEVSYNFNICASCDDIEVSDTNDSGRGPSISVANRDCLTRKKYDFYTDGSTVEKEVHYNSPWFKAIGGRNHGHKYRSHGERNHGHKYKAHGERNHGHRYKVIG